MAKPSKTWKLVVTSIIISLIILALFTLAFIHLIAPSNCYHKAKNNLPAFDGLGNSTSNPSGPNSANNVNIASPT